MRAKWTQRERREQRRAEGRPVRGRASTRFVGAIENVEQFGPRIYDEAQRERWITALYEGRVQSVIQQAAALLPQDPGAMKDARKEIAYLNKNKDCRQYDQYRAQHLFIGSGVAEAGCKHLIGHRLKQSGMEWTVRGANAIIALRCAILSSRFEDFGEQRATNSA